MSYVLEPDGDATRLLLMLAAPTGRLVAPALWVGDLVMGRRQLLNLKRLVEPNRRITPAARGVSERHSIWDGCCHGSKAGGVVAQCQGHGAGADAPGSSVHEAVACRPAPPSSVEHLFGRNRVQHTTRGCAPRRAASLHLGVSTRPVPRLADSEYGTGERSATSNDLICARVECVANAERTLRLAGQPPPVKLVPMTDPGTARTTTQRPLADRRGRSEWPTITTTPSCWNWLSRSTKRTASPPLEMISPGTSCT